MPDDAAPPGLRLLVADRYRVDGRLLVPGARVEAVDTRASAGRRVRIACLEADGPADGARARLEAWAGAYAAGLPVCEALHAVDDEPGPLLVLAAPPEGQLRGDPASLAAQARVLAGALAERGLRAGALGPLDLALARDGTLVATAPPPVAAVVDPRAEADRLAATVAAVAGAGGPAAVGDGRRSPDAGDGARSRGGPRVRLAGRRGIVRAATLVAAVAAVLLLAVGLPGGATGPGEPEDIPVAVAETTPAVPATVPELPPLPPVPQERAGDEPSRAPRVRPSRRPVARPAAARPRPKARPRAGARRRAQSRPAPRPARRVPARVRPAPRATPAPRPASRPRPRPASRWALGPDTSLGPQR